MGRREVVENYATDGLTGAVLERAAARAGDEPLTAGHLAMFDQFHMGGPAATGWVGDALAVAAPATVLDVGSGLGGPARQLAAATGALVAGVDLTPQHVAGATALSRAVGMHGTTVFLLGDAEELPFAAGTFDAAAMLFVGMNVADKHRLFAEVRRVLQDGGRFVVYDPVLSGPEHPDYPMPWAAERSDSHLLEADAYAAALRAAGFTVAEEHDCSVAVVRLADHPDSDQAGRTEIARLQFGEQGMVRFSNLLRAIRDGVVQPRLFVATAG